MKLTHFERFGLGFLVVGASTFFIDIMRWLFEDAGVKMLIPFVLMIFCGVYVFMFLLEKLFNLLIEEKKR